MTFRLVVKMDNAAFEAPGTELARILRELADDVDDQLNDVSGASANVRDVNGNTVGTWKVAP